MPKTLPLLRGATTLESALTSPDDMLLELSFPQKQAEFFTYLLAHQSAIENLVSFHLTLSKTEPCRMAAIKEWICGNFNVCIPVYIDGWLRHPEKKRVLIRFPLPYKLGEDRYPGNVEEKLRCEVATFIWIQENCPEIPVPRLWGFGFPAGGGGGQCTGYLLMEYIDNPDWKMLSQSWTNQPHAKALRANFFSDLSRIMLSLARFPFLHIGSLTIDNQGFLSLTNRPLTFRLQHLENKGVPNHISRTTTYTTMDAYFSALLSCHSSRIASQPNSILDHSDGENQLSVLSAMRALIPHFTTNDKHPFVFTLTDMHPNNIFVDANWRIQCLIDLEWSCVRPLEMMLLPPVWFTGRKVDELVKGEYLDAYSVVLEEFFRVFAEEERKFFSGKDRDDGYVLSLSRVLRENWTSGKFWYFHALDNPKVCCNLYFQHIQPMVAESLDDAGMATSKVSLTQSLERGALETITAKLKDRKVYEDQLRKIFEDRSNMAGDLCYLGE